MPPQLLSALSKFDGVIFFCIVCAVDADNVRIVVSPESLHDDRRVGMSFLDKFDIIQDYVPDDFHTLTYAV